jgi:hypothetical protein
MFLFSTQVLQAQERQVPVDEEGAIQIIDHDLEGRLNLFPEYEGFQEARMYQLPDSSFVIEITYRVEDQSLKKRVLMDAGAAVDFRRKVSQRIRERSPQATVDQAGRARLLTGTALLGLAYYGWALPVAFDVDDGRTVTAVYMLTAGSTFFIPFIATSHSQVTEGQATLSLYGGGMGILHGFLLYSLVVGEDLIDSDGRTAIATSMLTSVAEGVAGFLIAGATRLSDGKANVITGVGTAGLGAGAAIGYLAEFEDVEGYAGLMLLGTGAGFLAGNTLANMQTYTAGDATVLNTATALGAYVPAALLYAVGGKEDAGKLYIGTGLVGMAGGIYAGQHIVKGHDFSDADGNYVSLGTLAGGALGVGVAYLITAKDPDERVYMGASSLGLLGGFTLMYALLEDNARINHEARNWRFDISPFGLASLAFNLNSSKNSVPIASFSYSF